MCELKAFVITTLTNAGEDVMNKIIGKLDKRGKTVCGANECVSVFGSFNRRLLC